MRSCQVYIAILVCLCLIIHGPVLAQETPSAAKYKLTIVENASTSKRAKKGRVSSQAVVKLTDENDLPVPGAAIRTTSLKATIALASPEAWKA